jgi:hypothetical protein
MKGALAVIAFLAGALSQDRAHAGGLSGLQGLLARAGGTAAATPALPGPALPAPAPTPATPPWTATGPLGITAGAQTDFAALLGQLWPQELAQYQGMIVADVAAQSGTTQGELTIESLALTNLDITSPPGVVATPVTSGGSTVGEAFTFNLPGSGSWAATIDGHLSYWLVINLGFTKIKTAIPVHATVTVSNLQVSGSATLDTTNAASPTVASIGQPSVSFNLDIDLHDIIVDGLLDVFQPLIYDFLQLELKKLYSQLTPDLNMLIGKPGQPWGVGGPAWPSLTRTPDLLAAALETSDDIQNFHTPWGTVYEAEFNSPVYHQGTVVSYAGMGDSPEWTGTYLAGEAFRYATTRDPQAIAYAQKVTAGFALLFEVEQPGGGRLARYAIPTSSAFGQTLLPIQSGSGAFLATVNGVQYVCMDDISRDQYIGTMLGLSVAYDLFQDPTIQATSSDLIQRVVDYLSSTGWNALLLSNNTVSAPFIQAPATIVAFTACAERVNPSKYAAMRAQWGELASYDWISVWADTLDPLDSYFKWCLESDTLFTALRLETDPDRAMALEQSFAIMRSCIGGNPNGWFDAIATALDPALRSSLGPRVTDDMKRMVSRPRRCFAATCATDPTIEQATYSGVLGANSPTISLFGQQVTVSTPPQAMAKYPIPIEKMPCIDFIWQENPCNLSDYAPSDPGHENPGVDIVAPYWLGRYYGLISPTVGVPIPIGGGTQVATLPTAPAAFVK